jgi:hypothetical protein
MFLKVSMIHQIKSPAIVAESVKDGAVEFEDLLLSRRQFLLRALRLRCPGTWP